MKHTTAKNFFESRRAELGLTQRQIAESFDPPITPASVSSWECGIATPGMDLVDQGARIYRVRVSAFLNAIHAASKSARSRRRQPA